MDEHSLAVSYRDAVAFLLGRVNYERATTVPYVSNIYKLERMEELLRRVGNPQEKLNIVHIAGTKGKGSTAAMISSIACCCGYRVGLYTSPHLDRLEERFLINNEPCGNAELVEMVKRLRPVVEAMDRETARHGSAGGPTYFEVTTALAMLYFARSDVDLAILEVGMGGRLDSTNVCHPLVTAITSISFDHTQQLGQTLAKIAGEKAGIIKEGVPIVSGEVKESPRRVIEKRASALRAPLLERGRDFDFVYERSVDPQNDPAHFSFFARTTSVKQRERLQLGLFGEHQAANAAVALAVIDSLRGAGWKFEEAEIRHGLADVRCRGRFEVLQHDPLIVVDAAHNVASVKAFVDGLLELGLSGPRSLVFATTLEKDVRGMLRLLLGHFKHVVFTRYLNNPRAVPPEQLASLAAQCLVGEPQDNLLKLQVRDHPQAAWQAASREYRGKGAICVTGSFMFAAEMRRIVMSNPRHRPVTSQAETVTH
jgi:dihydrofolate synthase/folylpolyglutamate synthase